MTAPLVFAGLWLRAGLVAAFAALSAPLLVFHDALLAGDGVALLVLGAGFAWLAWRRTLALLGDETSEVASPATSARSGAAAA